MLNDLLIWVALLVGLVFLVMDKRRRAGALTLTYFLALSLGHVPGLLAYLDPDLLSDSEPTKVGFNVTLIGMTAFIAGATAARILPQRTTSLKAHQHTVSPQILSRLGWRMLTIGIVCSFGAGAIAALLPSLTAITSVLGALLILGIWVQLAVAANTNNSRRTLLILATVPLLPLSTLVTGGFIGFGTIWALSVMSFLFVITRRRLWFYLATPPVFFLGLSLFVTYAEQRNEIREVIWYQNADIMRRLDRVSTLITDFQFLDLSNESHISSLDLRLNQNYLVGAGVMRHREGETELLYGATVPYWALIPRAIWPEKPNVGGGGDVVAQFTGINFSEGTSVGVGQVLEFYINFGMPGVLCGFVVLGFILMRLDRRVMRALAMYNSSELVRFALPGLALLQPLGSLLEIVVAVASAIIVSQLLIHSRFLKSIQRPKTEVSRQTRRVVVRR
jgi:hypothetical protein